MFTLDQLKAESAAHFEQGGVSEVCQPCGFIPAFIDRKNEVVYLSKQANGQLCTVHCLDGLPEHLLVKTTGEQVKAVSSFVQSGFYKEGFFYTRIGAALALEGKVIPEEECFKAALG